MAPQSQAQLGVSSLQQLFVVGFGFSMILAKTLHLVVAGKYVDLSELLSVNIGEPKSHVLLDGRFIFFYFSFGHDIIFPASMGEHFVMFHSDDRAAVAIHQRIKP